jgi:predicted DNA-binding transcriptional regulator AlpA
MTSTQYVRDICPMLRGLSMQPSQHVLRTPQAAEYVGLSASTLEKFRLTGNGPVYQKAGPKIVVYRTEDLDAWLNKRRRSSTSDAGMLAAKGER